MNSRKSPSAYDNVYATTTSGSALQRLFSIGPMEERYEISISFLNSFVTSSNEDPVLDNEDLNIITYPIEDSAEIKYKPICISTNFNILLLWKALDKS